jgi:FtsP/CotA-like multicopper oxidase with cupredoxin domain
MPIPPIGRRQFVTTAGGALFCTLAGHHLSTDSHVDLDKLASTVPVPSTVRSANGQRAHPEYVTARASSGQTREYWIKAIKTRWDIVPTHRDGMMDTRVRAKTKFTALAYRSFSRGFARALGPPQIPGPLLEAETGDTIVVNFRNEVGVPVTIHPHGIFYTSDMDGSYKGNYTDRGGFVENKRSFQYVWEARPGTEGAWLYHDHGPMDPVPVFKGLFGPLIIRKPGVPRPDREFFLTFHSFTPLATGLNNNFSCVNGRAYAGNTPTLRARVGQTVAFHVFALDDDFHTFHLHGHRWRDPHGGLVIDNKTIGPGDIITAQFVEDNPGRWFYHCHVFSHLHMGMNGWYIVTA